jgi:prepilin-type processing-associated H-X9-DG protein/prepilin-type N-terminal cleavage/methylation domain-containing protein
MTPSFTLLRPLIFQNVSHGFYRLVLSRNSHHECNSHCSGASAWSVHGRRCTLPDIQSTDMAHIFLGTDSSDMSKLNHSRAQLYCCKQMLPQASHIQAFTLTELLVVIGIISVLAALLLPLALKINSTMKSSQCISNLKQLSSTITVAASDYGYYPVQTDADNSGFQTMPNLISVAKAQMIQVCPAAKWHGKISKPSPNAGSVMTALGYNPLVIPHAASPRTPVRPVQISRPSQVILAADCAQMENTEYPRSLGYCARWYGYDNKTAGIVANAEKEVTDDLVKSSGFWGDEAQLPLRHNGKANVVFVDGHVETIRRLGDLKEKNFYWNY